MFATARFRFLQPGLFGKRPERGHPVYKKVAKLSAATDQQSNCERKTNGSRRNNNKTDATTQKRW